MKIMATRLAWKLATVNTTHNEHAVKYLRTVPENRVSVKYYRLGKNEAISHGTQQQYY